MLNQNLARTILRIVSVVIFTFLGFAYFYQNKLLFFPDSTGFSKCEPLKTENISFSKKIDSKNNIRYYQFSPKKYYGVIILFHGNAGRACDRLINSHYYTKMKLKTIFVEYPGYSDSEMSIFDISEDLLYENASLAFDKIEGENKNLPIMIQGTSLGTYIATKLASEKKVAGLILDNPFTSILEIGKYHYPYLPLTILLKNKFPSFLWSPKVKAPVFISQGNNDFVTPLENIREQASSFSYLFQFMIYRGRGHNDLKAFPGYWKNLEKAIHFMLSSFYRSRPR